MNAPIIRNVLGAVILTVLSACGPSHETAPEPSSEDLSDRAIAAQDSTTWRSYGRDYTEQRFVDAASIHTENVSELGLAYSVPVPARLGISSTPLLVDGKLIFPTNFGVILAVDARTGEEIWEFDPEMRRSYMRVKGGAASRGVASYGDKILSTTADGRLIALDVNTGEKLWDANTFDGGNCNQQVKMCSITGAPRAARGLVFIGFGGAELNARGYISAYDVNTGELVWRFFTVPNDPDHPEHPEMELAAQTWSEGWNENGVSGGGTVWDSIVYDETYDQVIFGTGNAGQIWSQKVRDPGGGDNLFLASVIAVDVKTGKMNWYYQQVPGEQYDYTSAQPLVLAELEIDGQPRDVVMQAPKHGFFYIMDRGTGELISADPFARVNWADGVDLETGRPRENEAARNYAEKPFWLVPSPMGAGNWQPMAYSPKTGLVYIPSRETFFLMHLAERLSNRETYEVIPGLNTNSGLDALGFPALLAEAGPPPDFEQRGYLKAFDPVNGEIVWQAPMPHLLNGGAMVTSGDLVFSGDAMGQFSAFDANTGERLWSFDTYTSIIGAPISYTLDGEQYVAILTGWGMMGHNLGYSGPTASYEYGNDSNLFVFKLGGDASFSAPPKVDRSIPEPPEQFGSAADVEAGNQLYHAYCFLCHGGGARSDGVIPDLRMMQASSHDVFDQIVRDGLLEQNGMAAFGDVLSQAQARQIQAYIIQRASEDYAAQDTTTIDYRGGQ